MKEYIRRPADRTKWPHSLESNIIEPWPAWREVDVTKLEINKLRQCLPQALVELTEMDLFDRIDPHTREAIAAFSQNRPFDTGTTELVLTPERLTSLAEQSNQAEVARASIDVRALFSLAARAIATGDLTGTPLNSRDKIDLIKFLANKALPDAKATDYQDVVQRVDRGRRKASEYGPDQLKELTHAELLDLLEP
jgi:hypothetical protein